VVRWTLDSFVIRTNAHHSSDIHQVGDGLVLWHGTRLADAIGSSTVIWSARPVRWR
jgi:hypothetical protein